MNAEVTPLRPPQPPAEQARLNGVYDIPASGRVSGWAIDRSDPSAVVQVEVYREGTRIGTAQADRYRKDLEQGGIGTGRYGFTLDLDPPLAPGMNFTIEVRAVTDDGITGPLRATGSAASPEDPNTRVLERTFLRVAELSRQLDRVAFAPSSAPAPGNAVELEAAIERIELVQARLEMALASTEPPQSGSEARGLQALAKGAMLVALIALAVGLYSIFGG